MIFLPGFHIGAVDSVEFGGSLAGPFQTLKEAALAQIDIALVDSNNNRVATEVFYADDEGNVYVRWKKQWALEEEDGKVDPRAPLPETLKVHLNG